jgi:NAD(P)-dependent dehydrogenase (short-subunit alcohol dehydrogenase family)
METDDPWTPDPDALRDRIAVVAGATRGAGRGIATALGEAGATVYCTGRSSRRGHLRSDYEGRSETIEETAELVTGAGGTGIAVPVDHLDPSQVQALGTRIASEHRRIDVLVNDIWGAEMLKGPPPDWNKPIWETDLDDGLRIVRLGIETHLITAHALLPLVVAAPNGLHIEVTDGTRGYNADHYRISAFYDLVKSAVNRLAWALGQELEPRGATAVAVTPGWLRSEMMLDAFGVTEDNWRDADAPPGFEQSESPRYVGRAIASIAADPGRARWNQASVTSAELASVYGFTDLDGTRPDAWAVTP